MEISIAHSSSVSSSNATLLVALELSKATWVVALSAPFSDRISHHSIAGSDAGALLKLIGQARSRAEAALGQPVRVVCCYEAGYDGFWLHRVLIAHGVDNHVLDAASLLVNREWGRAAVSVAYDSPEAAERRITRSDVTKSLISGECRRSARFHFQQVFGEIPTYRQTATSGCFHG